MDLRIEDLLDFPSIQQLAGALWRQPSNGKGAAVLVGSGFSRNAERATADTPEPPLWRHLLDEMARRLYPHDPTRATSDPLRLAEEFRAYFGQSALDDFIRAAIPDASWYPGTAHKRLLELPWTEVLTTNWDTLLERASKKVLTHNYEIVRSTSDLAHTRSPRIVKLHGTVGGNEPYIFAEEDYRTYPVRHAAMVNFARQAFIENELCLLGFSGDDPNFLQWSGWVRDHLANASRRIYLVGVLGLGPAARKLLESRNIAPIDLKPLVKNLLPQDQHAVANDRFLSFLESSKRPMSYEWNASIVTHQSLIPAHEVELLKKPEYVASKLVTLSRELNEERKRYPGWLVCPNASRRQIIFQIDGIEGKLRTAKHALEKQAKKSLAVELAWRYDVSFGHLSTLAYDFIVDVAANLEKSDLDKNEQRLLGSVLLRHAREIDDDEAFDRWEKFMLDLGQFDQDAIAEAHYQRCLRCRDRAEFDQLEREVGSIEGHDPVWQMRKAFLLSTLRRWGETESLMSAALDDIRDRSSDARDSLWLRSRRTWSQWLLYTASVKRKLAERPDFSGENLFRCNPYEEIRTIRSDIHEELRDQRAIEAESFIPLFAPGTYRDNSDTIYFRSTPKASAEHSLMRLMETVGIPVSFYRFNMLSFFPEALSLSKEDSVRWYLQAAQYANDEKLPLTVANLGRISIALLDRVFVASLKESVLSALNYWRNRANAPNPQDAESAAAPITGLVSLLYRLTPRLEDDEIKECFYLGMELAKNRIFFRLPSSMEAIANLVEHAALSMSVDARSSVSLDAFEFPLASEVGANHPSDKWPDPFQAIKCLKLPTLRKVEPTRWSIRVATLLNLSADTAHRSSAVMRLVGLSLKGELTTAEQVTFGSAIWSIRDAANGLPAGTGLHAAVFTKLPHPSDVDPKVLLKAYLFSDSDSTRRDIHWLLALGYAASAPWGGILPAATQAKKLLRVILNGVKAIMSKDSHDLGVSFSRRQWVASAGTALAVSIFPAMKGRVSDDLFKEIFNAISSQSIALAISGLPYIADRKRANSIEEVIQHGLFSGDQERVTAATQAICNWLRLCKKSRHIAPPMRLIDSLLMALEARQAAGLVAILYCCSELLRGDYFNRSMEKRLRKAIVTIAMDYDYKNIEPKDRKAISASMVRVECVRILQVMQLRRGDEFLRHWLENAKNDPLVEVRHAAIGEPDSDEV